jgi:hypothetical protein
MTPAVAPRKFNCPWNRYLHKKMPCRTWRFRTRSRRKTPCHVPKAKAAMASVSRAARATATAANVESVANVVIVRNAANPRIAHPKKPRQSQWRPWSTVRQQPSLPKAGPYLRWHPPPSRSCP